jgi:hypothetical protein
MIRAITTIWIGTNDQIGNSAYRDQHPAGITACGHTSEQDSLDLHHVLYISGPKDKVVELLAGMLTAAQAVEVTEGEEAS